MLEPVDPRQELDRLIQERTCEWCAVTMDRPALLKRVWCRSQEHKHGYILAHWRNWRICERCNRLRKSGSDCFATWVFPAINNMPDTPLLEVLLEVQPMANFNNHFYAPRGGWGEFAQRMRAQGEGRVELDYKITQEGAQLKILAPSGLVKI